MIGLEIGIEQVDRNPADHNPPGPHLHWPAGSLDGGQDRLPVGADDRLERRPADIVLLVAVFLPPVEPEALVEIAFDVEQPDAHDRHPKVGGRLAMIARQYAEAARVDGHRRVQPEFGAEIGNGAILEVGIVAVEPGVGGGESVRHPRHDLVVLAQEITVARARGDPGGIDLAEKVERVVSHAMPERRVDRTKQGPCFAAPAPPQVHCEGCQSFDPDGQIRNAGLLGRQHRGRKLIQNRKR